jgi:hypothetical protein
MGQSVIAMIALVDIMATLLAAKTNITQCGLAMVLKRALMGVQGPRHGCGEHQQHEGVNYIGFLFRSVHFAFILIYLLSQINNEMAQTRQ